MIKRYCDSCGKETPRNVVSDRLTGTVQRNGKKIEYEVMVAIDGTWNAGELCQPCLLAAISYTRKKPGVQ